MSSTRVVRSGVAALVCCAALLGVTACRPGGSGRTADGASTRPSASPSPSASTSASTGPAGLSGRKIAARSLAAMKHLHSFTVRADVTDREGRTRGTVTVARNGCRLHGTVPGMGTVTYIRTRKATVVRLDEKAVRAIAGRAGAVLLAGKYLKVGDDPLFADLASTCRAGYFTDGLTGGSAGVSFRKAGTATVAGVPAVVIAAKGGGDSTRLYVAASGKPYLLKATGHAREYSGTVGFGDFDRVPRVHLPPAGRTIDIGKPHG